MGYFKKINGNPADLKVFVYDQEFQLVCSGWFRERKMKQVLNNCSLLFNIDNSGYFLRKK